MKFTGKILVVFLFSVLLNCVALPSFAKESIQDTSDWHTHCIGRYLIDLPPDIKINFIDTKIGGTSIQWRQDLTQEQAIIEAHKKIEEFKHIKHLNLDGSQFIDSFELPGGGIVIHRWNGDYSTSLSIMECYLISQDSHKRVFKMDLMVYGDSFALGKKITTDLAKTVYARDDTDPIPTEPGFAIYGGFLKADGTWRKEEAGISYTIPRFQGITGFFRTFSKEDSDKFYFDQKDVAQNYASLPLFITTLRKGDCDLNGIKAQELCAASTESGRRMYNFFLQAPAQAQDLAHPRLEMSIFSIGHPSEDLGNGFTSDAEALSLWNAIRDSIRLRPGAI